MTKIRRLRPCIFIYIPNTSFGAVVVIEEYSSKEIIMLVERPPE